MTDAGLLSVSQIKLALKRLGQMAYDQGEVLELVIVGGSAMALLFGCRDSTEDVDAITLRPYQKQLVRELSSKVADELGLSKSWLNDAAKGFLIGFDPGPTLLTVVGLTAIAPTLAQMLAMKLGAWRDDVDIADARILLENIEGEKNEVWTSVEPFLAPGKNLKAQYAFEDLWEQIHE